MMSLLYRALTHRPDKQLLKQFKPPAVPGVHGGKTQLINPSHYHRYCDITHWQHGDRLHPCYLQMLSLPLQMRCLAHPRSPFPLLGLVHRKNQISQQSGIRLSKPVTLRTGFSAVTPHRRGWDIHMYTTATQQERECYHAEATYLVRVKAPHVGDSAEPSASQHEPSAPPYKPSAPAHKSAEEAEIAERWQNIASFSAPADAGRRYARISEDANPIHLSAFTAKLFGFPKAIAHGMWTLAMAVSYAETDKADHSTNINCDFKRPLFLPGHADLKISRGEGITDFLLENSANGEPLIKGAVKSGETGSAKN